MSVRVDRDAAARARVCRGDLSRVPAVPPCWRWCSRRPAGWRSRTTCRTASPASLMFYGLGAGFYGRVSFTYALVGCFAVRSRCRWRSAARGSRSRSSVPPSGCGGLSPIAAASRCSAGEAGRPGVGSLSSIRGTHRKKRSDPRPAGVSDAAQLRAARPGPNRRGMDPQLRGDRFQRVGVSRERDVHRVLHLPGFALCRQTVLAVTAGWQTAGHTGSPCCPRALGPVDVAALSVPDRRASVRPSHIRVERSPAMNSASRSRPTDSFSASSVSHSLFSERKGHRRLRPIVSA